MSDHYCCKRCGLRYDDCQCMAPPTPPDKSLDQWYVMGTSFDIKQGRELEFVQRMWAKGFDTVREAEVHAYQSIGLKIVELHDEIGRLKALHVKHPGRLRRPK